jgi:RNA polymerase primary sigma factor
MAHADGERDKPDSLSKPTPEDSVRLYLRDIGRVSLITPHEERELIEDMVKARALPGTGADEEIRARGSKSRDRLIEGNLRLVVHVAEQYTDRGVALLDLIQEGNYGLMDAVDQYDPSNDGRFLVSIQERIRERIERFISASL